jgi:predicted phage tail protein
LVFTGALFLSVGVAAAQTTTSTLPPVKTIPVTGATTTSTTAKATTTTVATAAVSAAGSMASTGIAADMLVPLGFALIGIGGVMHVVARRPQRDLGLL